MRALVNVVLVAVTGLAVLPLAAADQTDPRWYGTWQLNLQRSTYSPGPAPYRRGTLRVEPLGNGVRMSYELVQVRGGVTRMEWDGRFDGRDYPVQGVDEAITYAYRRLDADTYEIVVRLDGSVVGRAEVRMSADGRTLTTQTVARGARGEDLVTTTVYEKRE